MHRYRQTQQDLDAQFFYFNKNTTDASFCRCQLVIHRISVSNPSRSPDKGAPVWKRGFAPNSHFRKSRTRTRLFQCARRQPGYYRRPKCVKNDVKSTFINRPLWTSYINSRGYASLFCIVRRSSITGESSFTKLGDRSCVLTRVRMRWLFLQ